MSEISIKAKRRSLSTKGAVNKLRKQGEVPGIFYSKGEEPIAISLEEISLKPLVYTSETHIVDLKIDDADSKKTILKGIQFDPVTDKIIHFDFQGISLFEEIVIEVPVVLEGQPKGAKDGGVLQHQMHKLQISCLPGDIPQHITINVANLGVGESVHVKDLNLDKVQILNNADVIVASVVIPKVVAETAAAEAGAETKAEPEIIGKGKTAEEEE